MTRMAIAGAHVVGNTGKGQIFWTRLATLNLLMIVSAGISMLRLYVNIVMKQITIKPQTEKEITKAVRGVLKTLGIYHWKQFQTLGSTPGVSDIIGIYKGKLLAVEVKTKRGKLSPAQKAFIDSINRFGGLAFVVRSVDELIDNLGVRDRFLM